MAPPSSDIVRSDPEILGGTCVFAGTRVSVRTLIDYLESGRPLADFLEDFPTVSREQTIGVLELAKKLVAGAAATR